jgi:hypothetical protein
MASPLSGACFLPDFTALSALTVWFRTLSVSFQSTTLAGDERIIVQKSKGVNGLTKNVKSVVRRYRVNQAWASERIRRCHYCGVMLTRETTTEDHIFPLGLGGKDKKNNIVFSCRRCNSIKGLIPYEDFKAAMLPVKQARRAGLPIPDVIIPGIKKYPQFTTKASHQQDQLVRLQSGQSILQQLLGRRKAGKS